MKVTCKCSECDFSWENYYLTEDMLKCPKCGTLIVFQQNSETEEKVGELLD